MTVSVLVEASAGWLRDPYAPEHNAVLLGPTSTVTWPQPQHVHEPLGRHTPIIISGPLRAASGQIDVGFEDTDGWQRFQVLYQQDILLLQTPVDGDQWWVRLGGGLQTEWDNGLIRRASCRWWEVDAP